jgi:hypothetical protein
LPRTPPSSARIPLPESENCAGTASSGAQFIRPEFAGELFGKDQPRDALKFFIVLPDGIDHGKSSKPSNSIHAKFPRYGTSTWWKRSIGCLPRGSALITRAS